MEDIIEDIKEKLYHPNEEICAYSCWTAGQIGRNKPEWYEDKINCLFKLLKHNNEKVRENALFALGWIGRANWQHIEKNIQEIISMHKDESPKVRLNMIWASENIAKNKPELFADYIEVFEKLLDDEDTKYVRSEAPEFFRVMGKGRPDLVVNSIPKLEEKLKDENKITQIHAVGALKIIRKNLDN